MFTIEFPQGRELDFIGLGRACMDLNANEINRPMEETITFTKYVGGSPANITIALARLGAKTGFFGRVSNDQFGRFITNYFRKDGIDTSRMVTDMTGTVSGLAFTEIKSPSDCSILMYRDNAADLKLEPGDIDEDYIRGSKALLISGTALAQSPSREAVFQALHLARKHGVVVFFDLDYRGYTWKSKEETSIYCNLVAEKCDVIIGGREEFDIMELTTGPAEKDDEATARRWFDHRAKLVVVKHGGAGSVAFTNTGERHKAGIFPADNVIKTFGAGDSFAGAFIYGLMQGWPIEKCQKYGSAAASIVVSSHNCSDAMPTLPQIEAFIGSHAWTGEVSATIGGERA
ncbi:5-dehydro-2-deoxygluconokinase [Paenibacillus humicola]|uniref:5-dehydro-2-deoxygluconokinase n=1 Tax=Paenibacillus humicola TaxID=3110540 RepID=UPI00237B7B1A|nr:5-dehydro-2-deoxygluconokinase [Paenibacillus humicola]